MGLRKGPRAWRVFRWARALPQYRAGHLGGVEAARASLPPTLVLAGAAYGGAGIPDCIRQGAEAARGALSALPRGDMSGGPTDCAPSAIRAAPRRRPARSQGRP